MVIEGDNPVHGNFITLSVILSSAGHEKSCVNQRGPSRKAKYPMRPIAKQYREGKVKRTSDRGVKQTLNPFAYKRSERR